MDHLRHRLFGFVIPALAAALVMPAPTAQATPLMQKDSSDTKLVKPTKNSKSTLDSVLQEALRTAPDASLWPNEHYVKLLDMGNVTVRSDGTTVAVYRETFKLFDENARNLAEVRLPPYNSSYESFRVLSARTIKKDGTVINVKPEDIREGGVAGDDLMYDDAHVMNFSMPGIEDNCVIDYTYELTTRPILLPGQFTEYWGFNDTYPIMHGRYVLTVPADKPARYKLYNDDTLQPGVATSADGRSKTYTWDYKDLKPIQLEPSMPHTSEVRTSVEFSSLQSWQDIASWFWNLQQPQAKPSPEIKAAVASLIAGKTTDEDKARAIYDWVANKTRYVGLEFGISAYKPHAAQQVYQNLYGDCKDKANLLITMLAEAGIKAHPVLLHAEERATLSDHLPTLNAFDHCIALAEVGGKDVWLDATAETCAYGDIPGGDRGVQVLVVKDGKGEFMTIPAYQPNENGLEFHNKIDLMAEGGAKMQSEVQMLGEMGQGIRAEVRTLTPDKRKGVMERIAGQIGLSGSVKDFVLPDGSDKNGPYVMKMNLDARQYGKKIGTLLLLPVVSSLTSGKRGNVYNNETRLWPVVNEETAHMQSETVYTLPEGYQVDEIPANVDLTSPIEEYHRKISKSADGKTLTVTDTLIERPGKVLPADYSKVKSFWDNLLKTTDDQVVLKKK
jgi:transglutaminase-like putative cysteine protease